jgi:acyl dehydratase
MASYPPQTLSAFEVGQRIETAGRTITEADVSTYAGVSGDYTQLHTNAERAGETDFGERIVHGPLTFACTTGLLLRTGILEGTIHSFLGCESMTFERPVFPGDTISATATVTEARELDSRDDIGLVVFDTTARDSEDNAVLSTDLRFMVEQEPSCETNTHVNGTRGDSQP